MKKVNVIIATAIICMATISNSFGTIRYVNNSIPAPTGPATIHYTTVAAAIAASASGDTVFIQGSPNTYGDFTVNVPVIIIGAGHNPQSIPALPTTVGNITYTTAGNGGTLMSVKAGDVYLSQNASNITIRRCNFQRFYQISVSGISVNANITIDGCVITGNSGNSSYSNNPTNNTMPNLMVRNNVIYGQITRLYGVSSVSSFIINNTFLSNGGNVFRYDDPCYDITVRNNIFLFAATNYTTATTLLFDHNVEVSVAAFPNGTNLISQVPAFVGFPTISAGFSYTADFHLTNPAQFGAGYGTDGTQVGVFGGIGQQFTYNQNGEPAIPIVRLLQVTNPVIQAGTPLNVNFITNVKQ